MAEESTPADLMECTRGMLDALSRRDFDTLIGAFAPDAVWEARGLGTSFEGPAEIRSFVEAWMGAYEACEARLVELRDHGRGVGLVSYQVAARPTGSSTSLIERWNFVTAQAQGGIERIIVSPDAADALDAAEQLAGERT
jgi:ketosteroid isomerase-like protein